MKLAARFLVAILAFFLGAQGFGIYSHFIQKPAHHNTATIQALPTPMTSSKNYYANSLSIETIINDETSSTHIVKTPQNPPSDMADFWRHMQENCDDGCKQWLECACSAESLDIKISDDLTTMTINTKYPEGHQEKISTLVLKWMQHRYVAYKPAPSITAESEFCCH